jgi:hypothetical protein
MISFLVCSIDPAHAAGVRANLAATVGVEHELLIHDNREAKWGLARVYNQLAGRARHPLLCFLHEDVRFRSPPGWGLVLIDFYASHPEAGLVGFAGSQVKSRTASGWSSLPRYNRMNLLQGGRPGGAVGARLLVQNPDQLPFTPVVVLDGLCLFASHLAWSVARFDEVTFPGFHLYDLDFSTQVALSRTNYVCHGVLPEHFSSGSFGGAWRLASEAYHRKWAARLPLSCLPLGPEELEALEAFAAYRSLRDLLRDPAATPASLAAARGAFKAHATARYQLRLLAPRLRAALRRIRSGSG